MEKKPSRIIQSSLQKAAVVTDTKKNQDATSNKMWPRASRRRESVVATSSSNRKPSLNRNRSVDKRPKLKGAYNNNGNNNEAELGSAFRPGSKKQSLNHLLNFHYTPRGDRSESMKAGGSSHRLITTHKHKYHKEQFLQANCQFVVTSSGDYSQYLNNPDALVDWDLVEQIHIQVSEFPSCPICLYDPVAAKMTRCGHIFCWSCVLHYLALSEKSWHKCPICYESIHKNDLKSVISVPHSSFNVGTYITFLLMKRAHGSITAVPVAESNPKTHIMNISETALNTVYSKLLLANPTEVMSIIERERAELTAQLKQDESTSEKCFIEQAITLLHEREQLVANKMSYDRKPSQKDRTRLESISSGDVSGTDHYDDAEKYYYFYQASDGQHVYLHALNIQMLEHTYGSLEHCPTSVNGRIVEKEGGSMTEEIRRRLRYLQHLPVTCQFEIAEIHIRQPVLNKETMEYFNGQIENRKKRRQRQARDEKRREKRILEEENRRMGRLPEVNVHIESFRQFPQFGAEDQLPGPSTSGGGGGGIETFLPEREDIPENSGCSEPGTSKSFANICSSVQAPVWPQLPSGCASTSGKCMKAPPRAKEICQAVGNRLPASDSDQESDDYVHAPAYNKSFSDAITIALEKASIVDQDATAISGSKKKKKNKQKVLFATSMGYFSK